MDRYTRPRWPGSALITIDAQCDTLDGEPFEIPGTSAVLPRMAALLEAFRKAQRPVIHIVRLYRADGSNVDLCRKEMIEGGAALLLAGSQGSQLAPELLPRPGIELSPDLLISGGIQTFAPGEVAIYKPRWGAFYGTPLESYLQEKEVSTLVFTGCNYPNCPRTSIYEASERDFRLVLAPDAISGLDDQGIREMGNIGVALLSAEQIIDAVRQAGDEEEKFI